MKEKQKEQIELMRAAAGTYLWKIGTGGQLVRVPIVAWSITVYAESGPNHPAGEQICAHPIIPGIPPSTWEAIQYPDGTVDDERIGRAFQSVEQWQAARSGKAARPPVAAPPRPRHLLGVLRDILRLRLTR